MGTKVEAAQPSAAEQELQSEQLAILKEQRAEQAALKPYLMQSMGLTFGDDGSIRKLTQEELAASRTPGEQRAQEIQGLLQDRQLQALRGELPVSPALEKELSDQKKMLTEGLSRKLGSGYLQTTAGQQALGNFQQRAGLLREEARRGQIGMGEGLLASRQGLLSGTQAQQYGQLQGFGASGASLLGQYSQAFQPFQFNRQLEQQANMQSAANKAGLISSAFGAAGTGLGLAYGRK